jgi:hypothetical protein
MIPQTPHNSASSISGTLGYAGDFRTQLRQQPIRPPLEAPQQLRDRPAAAHGLDAGQLPTLEQLGVSGPAPAGIAALGGQLIGGMSPQLWNRRSRADILHVCASRHVCLKMWDR